MLYDSIKWPLAVLRYSNATTHGFVGHRIFSYVKLHFKVDQNNDTDFSFSVKVQLWKARQK